MKMFVSLSLLFFFTFSALHAEKEKLVPPTLLAQKPGAPKVCLREDSDVKTALEEADQDSVAESSEPELIIDENIEN